jgi:hypothetical protein
MRRHRFFVALLLLASSAAGLLWGQARPQAAVGAPAIPAAGSKLPALAAHKIIAEEDCTAQKLGTSIPIASIGEPVSAVTLNAPQWHASANGNPAYCGIDGAMAPVDKNPSAKPIRFQVVLPASWSHRAAQLGGSGNNGVIPNLLGESSGRSGPSLLQQGIATYGSDSGHQSGRFGGVPGAGRAPSGGRGQETGLGQQGRSGAGQGAAAPPQGLPSAGRGQGGPGTFGPPDPAASDWALNDEAMANLGYMQLKKTHDAAMVLMERMYDEQPRFNYFFGSSQGGREALTVAQRYPADYDGVAANVPIVNFSTLMLAPELIRIQEKPLANWVIPAKVNAIRGEFMRQCDKLDGLADGIINNYTACRAIFDVTQGAPNRNPWAAKRCPDNVDPNPADTKMVYSRYVFATPLANGVKSFGMWLPNTDPSGSGLIAATRYRGQEGAAEDAPLHSHLGILGVTGFLMRDLKANPLDYVEGGPLNRRREQISAILDSTNPDLGAFYRRGGKLIVAVGTNDTLASPGAQLDYYQSVIDKMGQATVDAFARLFILPQTGHGLSGTNYTVDGDGKTIPVAQIPNVFDRVGLLIDWVENNKAPGRQLTLTAGDRSLPMCSYPEYPKYLGGPANIASSYACAGR